MCLLKSTKVYGFLKPNLSISLSLRHTDTAVCVCVRVCVRMCVSDRALGSERKVCVCVCVYLYDVSLSEATS